MKEEIMIAIPQNPDWLNALYIMYACRKGNTYQNGNAIDLSVLMGMRQDHVIMGYVDGVIFTEIGLRLAQEVYEMVEGTIFRAGDTVYSEMMEPEITGVIRGFDKKKLPIVEWASGVVAIEPFPALV